MRIYAAEPNKRFVVSESFTGALYAVTMSDAIKRALKGLTRSPYAVTYRGCPLRLILEG